MNQGFKKNVELMMHGLRTGISDIERHEKVKKNYSGRNKGDSLLMLKSSYTNLGIRLL